MNPTDVGTWIGDAFSAPHFGRRLNSGLPHAVQNFLPLVLFSPALRAAHRDYLPAGGCPSIATGRAN